MLWDQQFSGTRPNWVGSTRADFRHDNAHIDCAPSRALWLATDTVQPDSQPMYCEVIGIRYDY